MRVAIYLKNAIMQQLKKAEIPQEQLNALISRISVD